ncbi:hypothetical protein H4Q26_006123 [Puccinia striiformis f. sp. tritici PST-130]|nr:hypothetical protein H4Q26_006123 [Puccinia striiformis f. sp. tritici PST-130]
MPPRKKQVQLQAAAGADDDHAGRLDILKESYQALYEFHQRTNQKIQSKNMSPESIAAAKIIPTFVQLLDHLKTVIDHKTENRRDSTRLVMECSGLCDFFRYGISYLYTLPLKIIILELKSTLPVMSSPILGLMTYIYHVKLEECRAPSSVDTQARFKEDARDIGQCWESILAAFGDGIKLHVNKSEPGPKLKQFKVIIGKVFYPFLAEVLGLQNSSNPQKLSEYVKRSLFDAGEALSGGCVENKQSIGNPAILGPAILSHNIFNHSDFITVNIALQLAFCVAPPLKTAKGKSKTAKITPESKTAREDWFKQIFPTKDFGKGLQEEMVARLTSMSSHQFWEQNGEIQQEISRNDVSRACAIPIESGTIAEDQLRLYPYGTPILRNTVQFNKSSLTWSSSVSKLDGGSIDKDQEMTAEICYDAILVAQLTGSKSSAPLPRCEELTLSIEFRSDFPIESSAPAIHYAPDSGLCRSTLVLKLQSESADAILRILNDRNIKSTHVFEPRRTDSDQDADIARVDPEHKVTRRSEKLKCEASKKISISQDDLMLKADDPSKIPTTLSSRQRVESVQKEAEINSSREEASNSLSEQRIDSGTRDPRSPSVAEESTLKTSPTVVHTRAQMSPKRKSPSRESSPIEIISPEKIVVQGQKSKRIRIVESPSESVGSQPAHQSKQALENETRKALHSTAPKKKPHARAVSAESVGSCSDAGEDPVRSDSIHSIDEAYEKILTSRESESIARNDSEPEDEILEDDLDTRSPQSLNKASDAKIKNGLSAKKNKDNCSPSVMDFANGFRPVARRDESGGPKKAQSDFTKDSDEAGSSGPPLKDWKTLTSGLKPKRTLPTKNSRERDTFSPDTGIKERTHATFGNPTSRPDHSKGVEHGKKATDQQEPHVKKTQLVNRISSLVRDSSKQPKKASPQDESLAGVFQDSKTKKSADRSIQSITSGLKRTAEAPSPVDPVIQEKLIPLQGNLKPIKKREASGSNPFPEIADIVQGSSTPLSRMGLEGCDKIKQFIAKRTDSRKPKQLRFESPHNSFQLRKTSSTRSHKKDIPRRDTPPPFEDHLDEDEMVQSTKRRKLKLEISKDSEDRLKSALKNSTPQSVAPKLNLKDLQKITQARKVGGSPILEVKDTTPNRFYQSSSSVGKVLDRSKKVVTGTSPSSLSEFKNDNDNTREDDISNHMDQLSKIVVDGIKNKQVKLESVASTTRSGVLNLTNNLVKEFDHQRKLICMSSEEISEAVEQRALQKQNEHKQYRDHIKAYRIEMEPDLNWAQNTSTNLRMKLILKLNHSPIDRLKLYEQLNV